MTEGCYREDPVRDVHVSVADPGGVLPMVCRTVVRRQKTPESSMGECMVFGSLVALQ